MTLPADIDDRSFRGRDEARPMLSRDARHRAWWLLVGRHLLASATRPASRRSDDVNAFTWQAVRPEGGRYVSVNTALAQETLGSVKANMCRARPVTVPAARAVQLRCGSSVAKCAPLQRC